MFTYFYVGASIGAIFLLVSHRLSTTFTYIVDVAVIPSHWIYSSTIHRLHAGGNTRYTASHRKWKPVKQLITMTSRALQNWQNQLTTTTHREGFQCLQLSNFIHSFPFHDFNTATIPHSYLMLIRLPIVAEYATSGLSLNVTCFFIITKVRNRQQPIKFKGVTCLHWIWLICYSFSPQSQSRYDYEVPLILIEM